MLDTELVNRNRYILSKEAHLKEIIKLNRIHSIYHTWKQTLDCKSGAKLELHINEVKQSQNTTKHEYNL
jgi:hypothetical protein